MVTSGSSCASPSDVPLITPGLVQALTSAYATLLKRQRTVSAAFVRWSTANTRAHDFAWLEEGQETLISSGKELRIEPGHRLHEALNKMMATIQLNPYERELLYGYPYVIGYLGDAPIRGPLLTIPITITTNKGALIIKPNEEIVRFNSLPFRSESDSAAHELSLARLIEATPAFPVTAQALQDFCASVAREMKVSVRAELKGRLNRPPGAPRAAMPLQIMDYAACFVAPKTSYFLASDLETIGKQGDNAVKQTALGWVLGQRGNQPTSNDFGDPRNVYFPFSSNPSQRRVGLLASDPSNHILVVSGPPGTGKSLTITNLVCHLVALGKRVLVTSQKDKALQVVDELLRTLDLDELPMTLLRRDQDSKRELRQRLDSIDKARSAEETRKDQEREGAAFSSLAHDAHQTEDHLAEALFAEHLVAQAEGALAKTQSVLRRIRLHWGLWEARRSAKQRSREHSDHYGDLATQKRTGLLSAAIRVLQTAGEHRTGEATRNERNQLREFSKLLGRSQTSAKNFSIFDRLKREPERCHMLLKTLPCWIMTPDDVARLFPCEPGLFDVVILDEASQIDLPSITPILYRAKQAVVCGDSKQMQAQRFAFTSNQVAVQAWQEYGLDRFDPDRWLDPSKIDLLQLATIRADEAVLLNEHFRSLPDLISFSNARWYGGQLRLMRDAGDRRFGDPSSAYVHLHPVKDGSVKPGTQENEREAQALVDALKTHLEDPGYAEATFGVLALFEEQVRLLNEMIAEQITEEVRQEHDLVVVNPDGFQGDERDVIFYSLSYDAQGMEQSQISARQAEREHIQGMLNVAFTRARDEIRIFHTAPPEAFGMASGGGAIREWLEHCAAASAATPIVTEDSQLRQTQSEFEAQVLQALHAKGVHTVPQYPACGFFIDIVTTLEDQRLAIECDGELWHLDEHGRLKQEDCVRQEILERAGWRVLRIPYRGWRRDPAAHIQRVMAALTETDQDLEVTPEPSSADKAPILKLSIYEAAIIHALVKGAKDRDAVLRAARLHLGYARLGPAIRHSLENAMTVLIKRDCINQEDGELFASEQARTAKIVTTQIAPPPLPGASSRRFRPRRRYRRW